MQHTREGFRHRNLIVFAVQYELASTPPSWLIVWLDSDGNSLQPWVRSARAGRRIVTTKPGDVICTVGSRSGRGGRCTGRRVVAEEGGVG